MSTPTPPVDTHNVIFNFGRHNGTRLTRVPVDYLRWVYNERINRNGVDWAVLAEAELDRRGGNYNGIQASLHAVDRFSQRFWERWNPEEIGIAALLSQLATTAWGEGTVLEKTMDADGNWVIKKVHDGIKFVFQCDPEGHPHTLKTVM